MPLRILAGASGYSFKEWKGAFYPQAIKPEAMLSYYADRLHTVEINSSFYALPKAEIVERWAASVPEDFRFSIKAPQAITHRARLKDTAADELAQLYRVLEVLGDKRGPVLFQLPPTMKKDLPRLRGFLELLPAGHRAVFEFRHDSWFDDEVYACLREFAAVLCVSEREDASAPPLVQTADWGYVRLRLESYGDDDLAEWIQRFRAAHWKKVHVYFQHNVTAPGYAADLLRLAAAKRS